MLSLIIGIILLIFIHPFFEDDSSYFKETSWWFTVPIIIVTVIILFSWNYFTEHEEEWSISRHQNIYSSGDVFGAKGSMFHVDTEGHFFFYKKVGEGYRLDKIENAYNWTIIEDEEISPYFAEYIREDVSWKSTLFGTPYNPTKKEIHVPKKSVIQGHTYDIKN